MEEAEEINAWWIRKFDDLEEKNKGVISTKFDHLENLCHYPSS